MESIGNFLSEFYDDVTDWMNIPRGNARTALKWVYWIVGILFLMAICYILYNRFEKPVSAVLMFMGGWMLLMYYWVKWFKLTEKRPLWPPFIAPCPDFLTLITPESASDNIKCVDYVGVSNPNAANPLKKASPTSIQTQINNSEYYFTFERTVTDPETNQQRKPRSIELCSRAKQRGLVWSGVCEEV